MQLQAQILEALPVVRPMQAFSWDDMTKAEQKEQLREHKWVSEEKIDGCRMIAHVTPDGLRLQSGKNGHPIERTINFPHIAEAVFEGVAAGTVFDCEVWLPTDETETSAVVQASPEKAEELQEKYGPAELHIFDIISSNSPEAFSVRRSHLERIFDDNPHLADHSIVLVEQRTDLDAHFEAVRAAGGEGIVMKRLDAPYIEGSHLRIVIKRPFVNTVDGWISGSTRGKKGIGALRVSYRNEYGTRDIGAFKLSCANMRKKLLDPDGNLWPDIIGRAVEVKGNGWTRNGCLRNLQFVRWRPDKRGA